MKKFFRYLNVAMLLIAISTAFTACVEDDDNTESNLGLTIKVFSPTVVVPGQPMTINGSGFNDVTEIVFPGDLVVKEFEIITDEMIRVAAPAGLTEGGTILVRNAAGETAVSRLPLTVGKTQVLGYSAQEGDVLKGNEAFTAYGTDMQFVSRAEFIDEDGNSIFVDAREFIRVASGRVVIQIPGKVITGKAVVRLYTADGQVVTTPEFEFETATNGGHWETVKRFLWENDGTPVPSWGGTFRFGLEGHDGNNECIATFDQASWDIIKEGTFYFLYDGNEGSNVRITTGWWSAAYGGPDHNCIDFATDDEETGMKVIEMNIKEEGTLYGLIDDQHLLFTGDAYTPVGIYVLEQVWIEGGEGHFEKVKTTFWKNETGDAIPSWGGTFRFGMEGKDGNNECIATFDEATWNILKTEPFRIAIEPTGEPNIRVTTGWWSTAYGGGEYNCAELIEEDENGNLFVELNLSLYEDLLAAVDDQHLLFTGDGYKLLEIYQEKDVWIEGGDSAPKAVVIWENADGTPIPSWGGTFRFCLDGHDFNNECIATFDEASWNVVKEGTFYALYEGTESTNVRITTGWWSGAYGGTDHNCAEEATDDAATGLKCIKINIKEDGNLYDNIDEQHLLFTGDAYTLKKLIYYE